MRQRFVPILAAILLGSVLFACGGSAPEEQDQEAPTAEASSPSEGEPAIHEDGFETGDEEEWTESVTTPDDEDSEPDVP